jgi:hypothetical protein
MCVRLANYLTKALLIYCVGITYECEYKYFSAHSILGPSLFKEISESFAKFPGKFHEVARDEERVNFARYIWLIIISPALIIGPGFPIIH